MYYLLTESFKEQHTKLVKIILEAVDADKIYFLGSTLMRRRTESIFMTDAPSCSYVGHYYILVLIENGQGLNVAQDKIENSCQHFIHVTAIVLYKDQFRIWLEEGRQFARTVKNMAVLLHGNDEKNSLSELPNDDLRSAESESLLSHGLNKVTEFLAGADLYRVREQNKMAAFMLHQAVEQGLTIILRIKTGLNFNTHNLDKLIRYCSMVSYNVQDIFPKNNENDQRLFKLLQRAYIDGRYKVDFIIRTEDLLLITERVRRLLSLMKSVFQN